MIQEQINNLFTQFYVLLIIPFLFIVQCKKKKQKDPNCNLSHRSDIHVPRKGRTKNRTISNNLAGVNPCLLILK